jgi:hypothetical protein
VPLSGFKFEASQAKSHIAESFSNVAVPKSCFFFFEIVQSNITLPWRGACNFTRSWFPMTATVRKHRLARKKISNFNQNKAIQNKTKQKYLWFPSR